MDQPPTKSSTCQGGDGECLRLVADIGGTNVRFALSRHGRVLWNTVERYRTQQYPSVLDAVRDYLSKLQVRPFSACFAVAGPATDGGLKMTNGGWTLRRSELKRFLNLQTIEVINDFAALAYSLPHLRRTQLVSMGGNTPIGDCRLVIGPGTGFGAAALINTFRGPLIIPGEGGHAALGAANELELALFGWLLKQRGETSGPVYRELLLSGPGLELLDQGLAAIHGRPMPEREASAITAAALSGDEQSLAVIEVFSSLLGGAARDLALSLGARAGVFIAGGIVRRFLPLFQQSGFRQQFECSPSMGDYLSSIPVYVISESGMGLQGAAVAPLTRAQE